MTIALPLSALVKLLLRCSILGLFVGTGDDFLAITWINTYAVRIQSVTPKVCYLKWHRRFGRLFKWCRFNYIIELKFSDINSNLHFFFFTLKPLSTATRFLTRLNAFPCLPFTLHVKDVLSVSNLLSRSIVLVKLEVRANYCSSQIRLVRGRHKSVLFSLSNDHIYIHNVRSILNA